jgi:hypothetical protein
LTLAPAMAHPLLHVVATQPELLVTHAQGYAALAADEWRAWAAHWRRRAWLTAATVVCAAVTAVLCGVAVLLWVVTPQVPVGLMWVLWAVPAVTLVPAVWCAVLLLTTADEQPWQAVQAQLALDVAAWRTPGPV